MIAGINFLAVLACVVASLILGFIWYGPLLGKAWMKAAGMKPEQITKQSAMKGYIISMITSFFSSWGLAVVIKLTGAQGILGGIYAGAGVSVAFVAMFIFSTDAYEDRLWALSFINSGYRVLFFVVAGIILALWR